MAVIDDFKARFPDPEFATADVDSRLPALIDEYSCFYNFPYEGCHKAAILYLLAHMMVGEVSASSGASQLTASKSVGNVSVSYASLASNSSRDHWLNATKYGQRFLLLSMKQGARALFV